MPETQSEDGEKSKPTAAGCLLMLLSLAVIVAVAFYALRWRDPETGWQLPRSMCVVIPVLAGSSCYGIGTGILYIFGLSVEAKPKNEDSDKLPPDEESPG